MDATGLTDIRHQSLKTHVLPRCEQRIALIYCLSHLDPSYVLGPLKVFACTYTITNQIRNCPALRLSTYDPFLSSLESHQLDQKALVTCLLSLTYEHCKLSILSLPLTLGLLFGNR